MALIRGAAAIAALLQESGLLKKDDPNAKDKVYYLARTQKLPIGRFGKDLIADDNKLLKAAESNIP